MIETLDRAIPGCDSAIIRLVAVVKIEDIAVVSRGSGILTKPLVTRASVAGAKTRTFADTGETVEHLSAGDLMGDPETA